MTRLRRGNLGGWGKPNRDEKGLKNKCNHKRKSRDPVKLPATNEKTAKSEKDASHREPARKGKGGVR